MVRRTGNLRGKPYWGSPLLLELGLDDFPDVYFLNLRHKKSVELNLAWTPGFHAHSSNKLFHAVMIRHFITNPWWVCSPKGTLWKLEFKDSYKCYLKYMLSFSFFFYILVFRYYLFLYCSIFDLYYFNLFSNKYLSFSSSSFSSSSVGKVSCILKQILVFHRSEQNIWQQSRSFPNIRLTQW